MIGYNFNELILSMASELISSKQCFDWNIEVKNISKKSSQPPLSCSKSAIKKLGQCMKSVQS